MLEKSRRFENMVFTLLFIIAIRSFFYISNVTSQFPKNFYFYMGFSQVIVIFIIASKCEIRHWINLATIILCIVCTYLQIDEWIPQNSYDIIKWIVLRNYSLWLLSLLLVDMFMRKKFKNLRNLDWIYIVPPIIVFFITFVFSHKSRGLNVVILFAFLFVIADIDIKKWLDIVKSFWIGYVIVWVNICVAMIKTSGGDFRNPGKYIIAGVATLGQIGVGVVTLTAYMLTMELLGNKKKKSIVIYSCVFLFSVVMLSIIGIKVTILGVVTAMITCLIYALKEKNAIKGLKIFGMVIPVLALLGIVVVRVVLLIPDGAYNIISNNFLRRKIKYWITRINMLFKPRESKFGIISENSWLNGLDWFSSGRISLWKSYAEKINWFGNDDISIFIGERYYTHPHNTFYMWLVFYGLACFIILIIWFTYEFVKSIKMMKRNGAVYYLTFLWMLVFVVLSMFDTNTWNSLMGCSLLLLQYPLLRDISNKATT